MVIQRKGARIEIRRILRKTSLCVRSKKNQKQVPSKSKNETPILDTPAIAKTKTQSKVNKRTTAPSINLELRKRSVSIPSPLYIDLIKETTNDFLYRMNECTAKKSPLLSTPRRRLLLLTAEHSPKDCGDVRFIYQRTSCPVGGTIALFFPGVFYSSNTRKPFFLFFLFVLACLVLDYSPRRLLIWQAATGSLFVIVRVTITGAGVFADVVSDSFVKGHCSEPKRGVT